MCAESLAVCCERSDRIAKTRKQSPVFPPPLFAMKGGTGINLVIEDIPRLLVDKGRPGLTDFQGHDLLGSIGGRS
jgi:hypothetical protein